MDDRQHDKLDSRIGKLEVSVQHLADSVNMMVHQHQIMQTSMAERSRTDWSTIAAWAAVVVSMGVAVYWPINEKITLNRESTARIEEDLNYMRGTRWTKEDHTHYADRLEMRISRIEDRVYYNDEHLEK